MDENYLIFPGAQLFYLFWDCYEGYTPTIMAITIFGAIERSNYFQLDMICTYISTREKNVGNFEAPATSPWSHPNQQRVL